MNSRAVDAALDQYGLANVTLGRLAGGTINRVWRVDAGDASFVLKEYRPASPEMSRLPQVVKVQMAAHAQGLPVPALLPNRDGRLITTAFDQAFTLSEYVPGRLFEPGTIPTPAARNMGKVLGHLHDALLEIPLDEQPELPSLEAIEERLRGLLGIARSRQSNPVDSIAVGVLEAKLDLLATIESVPACEPQWTHGDYEWRNVLFDEQEHVAAVIDFDNAIYYSAERDVMRCIALSFPHLESETDDFFEGYATIRHVGPHDAASYVELYRYFSTYRYWPISERYLHPERYQAHWDDMIRPFVAWDWDELAERLAQAAANAARR